MADHKTFSSYAVLYELNNRELKRKLDLFPEELRYYAVLANGIIGSENAKRLKETPEAVVEDSREFVEKLLGMASPETDDAFKEMLETYLIETLKDELRCCCSNCANFNSCLDMENLPVGLLFQRRVNGEETDELKREISLQIENALQRTPYINTDNAHKLCKDFRHQYSSSDIGEVFGRYSDIAAGLQVSFGIDYKNIQQEMISINMEFCEKDKE
ncbi:MAG: hypothetical protein M1147_10925 [Nitrospirae bacterium]|nr:hypothetical protein [Nitrospirota bacterium]MCL5978605.1 hypothetical protein [Nitrospirota bacterium]